MKLYIVFKDVLAKKNKKKKTEIIKINKEKEYFGPILGHFWAIFGPIFQRKAIFFKKSFKRTLMTISMLFRDIISKMSQKIRANLEKQAILG